MHLHLQEHPRATNNVYDALYNRRRRRRRADNVEVKPKFKIGGRVRILKKEKTFEKGFTPNWTVELFIVSAVSLSPTILKISSKVLFTNKSFKKQTKRCIALTRCRGKEKGVTERKKHL